MPRFLCKAAAAVAVCARLVTAQGFTELSPPLGLPAIPHAASQYGAGTCVADFFGNGRMDVLIGPAPGANFVLLRNDGQMIFTDMSAGAGLGSHPRARCVQAADVDNDGDPDVYVGGDYAPARLYINDGTGVFVEQAALRGLLHAEDNFCASFGDFDRDGWVDLAVGNRMGPGGLPSGTNRLYRNVGGGHFVDVTPQQFAAAARTSFCFTFVDFDEDLWPDLMEVNERGPVYGANELYRNNGDGTFTPVGAQYGCAAAIDGMGIDFVDAFNDGGVDLFMTDTPIDHLFHVWDDALGAYAGGTATFGFPLTFEGWGTNFLDYDNDGWQDLYVVHTVTGNSMLHNPAAPVAAQAPWTDVAAALGLASTYLQHVACTADFDDDGGVDILQRFGLGPGQYLSPVGASLHRNDAANGNWLKLTLEGTRSNRDGLGAIVEVRSGANTQRQHRRSGIGFLGGSDPRLHFGLGTSAQADRVTITWPSGQVQYLTDVAANQALRVEEPTMLTDGVAPVGGSTTVTASIPGDEGLAYLMPLSLGVGTGITFPDGRRFPLDQDSVLDFTIDPFNPIFVGSFGLLDAQGRGTATFLVPPLPWLSGLTVYSAALTLDPPSFPLIRTILHTPARITIQ